MIVRYELPADLGVIVRVLRVSEIMQNRDHVMMEKELAYASLNLSNRASEMDEMVFHSMSQESIKPAYLRRKVVKGRSTESQ